MTPETDCIGWIVFAHGSSVETANDAVRAVTSALALRGAYSLTETAFLEGGKPDLPEACQRLIERGAVRIVVLPYFLTTGLHLKRDLPRLLDEVRASHPALRIETTPPLDGHAALVDILLTRATDAASMEHS
jgi:sirohydrochlorin ferrochelatase